MVAVLLFIGFILVSSLACLRIASDEDDLMEEWERIKHDSKNERF